jgi:predicted DNA binding CopG/RHH family protein
MPRTSGSEKAIVRSVGRGEWKSVPDLPRERGRYRKIAQATQRKDRRVNIRISGEDLDAIRERAVEEGLPYQTLIASLLHKYAAGRLVDLGPARRAGARRATVSKSRR